MSECEHKDTYFEHTGISSIDEYVVYVTGNVVCEECGEIVASNDTHKYVRE